MCEQLKCSNILALVGTGEEGALSLRNLTIWNIKTNTVVHEISKPNKIEKASFTADNKLKTFKHIYFICISVIIKGERF